MVFDFVIVVACAIRKGKVSLVTTTTVSVLPFRPAGFFGIVQLQLLDTTRFLRVMPVLKFLTSRSNKTGNTLSLQTLRYIVVFV